MSNKVLFIIGRTSSILGTQLYNFVFGLMILYTTGSAINFAVTLMLETVPRIIFGTVSGIIADRYDRQKILIGSDCLSGTILLVSFFALLRSSSNLWLVYILTFVLNAINTVFDTAMNSSLENLFGDDGLDFMCSINEGISSTISLLAPTIGAVIYALTSFQTFILINGISFFLSAFSEIFLRYPKHEKQQHNVNKSIREEMGDAIAYLKDKKVVFELYFLAIFINVFYGVAASLAFPIILTRYAKVSEIEYGIIDTIVSLGMVIGSVLFSLIRAKRRYILILASLMGEAISILLIGLPTVLNIHNNIFLIYCIIAAILGLSVASVNISVRVLLQKLIPNDIKGKILGTLSSLCMSISPITILLGSLYIDNHDPSILVLICGICFIIVNAVFSRNKEIKKY